MHHTVTVDITPKLYEILERVLNQNFEVHRSLHQIQEKLDLIMATQEEFDAQIAAANASLDAIATDVTNIGAAVTAEAQQIADFIASQPAGVDTSALAPTVDKLNAVAASLAGTADAVSGIFTPPAPAPAPEPTPAP